MSKVIIYRAFAKDTFPVSRATVAAGWTPGNLFCLNTTGEFAQLASGDQALFVAVDDDLEVSAPPTGSIMTGVYGSGTKITIDHSQEVAASSAVRAYSTVGNPEAAALNADLYCNASGFWTTTVGGVVKGKLIQIPNAANNFGLGIILRF